jgi:uncharacterized protein (DUF433 family)
LFDVKRPIVGIPGRLGGLPHIDGTTLTITELQAYWAQPEVGAAQMRARFPELTEAELGAAVTYAEPRELEHSFSAEVTSPVRKRLHIYGERGSWMFVCDDLDETGASLAGWDVWEDSFAAILRYPTEHAARDVVWRDDRSGEVVDIYALSFPDS